MADGVEGDLSLPGEGILLAHAHLFAHRGRVPDLLHDLPAEALRLTLPRLDPAAQQDIHRAVRKMHEHHPRPARAIKGHAIGPGPRPVVHTGPRRAKYPVLHLIAPSASKRPLSLWDRGRKLAVPPLFCRLLTKTASGGSQQNPCAVPGAPVRPYWGTGPVQAAAPRGIHRTPLSPFHQNGGSLGRCAPVTGPHPRIGWILPQSLRFVKPYSAPGRAQRRFPNI